jgi:multidrug efflux pump subunit AcrB
MGFKSATIVGTSLLVTILLTLVYMYLASIDLQRVSLGTFILALGMLVDNAIVITDMYTSKVKSGIEKTKAATDCIHETALPLLGATFIAIMGASPVLFSQTDAAEFAGSVFKIMCSSLLLSWLVAMTITPLMCWLWLKPEVGSEEVVKPSRFKKVIGWTVDNPKKALSAVVPLLLMTAVVIPQISVNFMPSSDRPVVFLDYWLPNGAKIEETSKDMKRIEAWLLEQPEVDLIIKPLIKRGDAWLESEFPQAEPRFRSLKLATKDKFSIEARFTGPDPDVLRGLSQEAQAIFNENPYTKYVRDDWRQTSKVLVPIINQEQARRAGINRADIAMALKRSSDGMILGAMQQGDELIPLLLKSPESSMASLETIPVKSLLGIHSVPLGQVVDGFELKNEESMIWRRDRVPSITAQAAITEKTAAQVRSQVLEEIEAIQLPYGYTLEWGGEYYDEHRSIMDTFSQLPKALIFMVIILVAMFNGFKQPVIILTTVPLAATGASLSLLLFDKPFGYMALIGAVALSGMIVKNGIVLMDQIELERKQGKLLGDAIKDATLNRTMAISLGALTTALGMIPLLSDRLFDQMAATIIGGLAAATFLSLLAMPAMYKLFYKNDRSNADINVEMASIKNEINMKDINHENA